LSSWHRNEDVVLQDNITGLFVCAAAVNGEASQTLSQFLAAHNLSHVEDILLANGFDELDFMVEPLFSLFVNV